MAYCSHHSRVVVQVNPSSSDSRDSRKGCQGVGHGHSGSRKRDHEKSQVHKSKEGYAHGEKSFIARLHRSTIGHQGGVHSGTTRCEHSGAVVVHVVVDQATISDMYKEKDSVQQRQESRQQKEKQCSRHSCSTAKSCRDHEKQGRVNDQYQGRGQNKHQSRGRGQDRDQSRGRDQDRDQSRGRGQDRDQSKGRGQGRDQGRGRGNGHYSGSQRVGNGSKRGDDSKKVTVVNNYYLQGSHVKSINPMH